MEKKYSYKNPFHKASYSGSLPVYHTDDAPIEYKGYQIFHRIRHTVADGNVCDLVKDGVIVSQRVTVRNCKTFVDTLTNQQSS